MPPLLKISNLGITLRSDFSSKTLLRNIDLSLDQEQIVALVGASGGGKTSLGLSILRLLPAAMEIDQGSIIFKEKNLLELDLPAMQHIRGKEIGMIFQESLSAFNPVFRVGDQIAEVLQTHLGFSKGKAMERAWELLDLVEINDAKRVAHYYPHELSGGLRQRAMIAQAIAASPEMIIADEPTSNLDVTIQAKILELFKKLRKQMHLSILLITHDLGLVHFMADRLFVLYDGRIVESGEAKAVLDAPAHDFTRKLLKATRI
jgi:ABC-type dipeptide/oligopeptide/nickel transport system ATPase component